MKPVFIKHTKIDKELWDKKIKTSRNSRIYGLSSWLDIASPSWDALISPDYEFIMPLPVKKKFGIKYLVQPKFTQQTGIFSKKKITPEIVNLFLDTLSKKYLYSAVNLNSENKMSRKDISEKPNHLLNLHSPYDVLKSQFSENTKRNIKKASRFNNVLIKAISVEDAVLLKKNNNINSLSEGDLKTLQNLIFFTKSHFKVKIYGVYNKQKKLISATVFSFYKNRIYLPLITSSEEGKKTFAAFQIFNSFLEDHSGENLILDFEGSSLPGVARFFEGWGAKPESYYFFEHKKLPLF